jgi:hypothetical protein
MELCAADLPVSMVDRVP